MAWHCAVRFGNPYLEQRRAELENARRSATLLLARTYLDQGEPDLAVDLLRALLAEDSGSEPFATLLVQALTAPATARLLPIWPCRLFEPCVAKVANLARH
ncbi:bacterial transcriptional activator domain-containing protein [Catenulispora yoronensis]